MPQSNWSLGIGPPRLEKTLFGLAKRLSASAILNATAFVFGAFDAPVFVAERLKVHEGV